MMQSIKFNPEVELKSLIISLQKLEASMIHVQIDEEKRMQLRQYRKELETTYYFYNHYVIAVTGSQGVGKSTLANELLGHHDLTPASIGNDEKYPVYISEIIDDSIENREIENYIIVCLGSEKDIVRECITKDEFDLKVTKPNDENILWFEIEIRVPQNKRMLGSRKLVVLPGYSPNRKDELSNNSIVSALKYSSSCIICFDYPTFAKASNNSFIDSIVLPYFGESTPIFALTKSNPDESNADFNEVVKSRLRLKKEDSDRIINTWSSIDGDTAPWKDALLKALYDHSETPVVFRKMQLEELRKTLEAIKDNIFEINDNIINQYLRDEKSKEFIRPFEKSKEKILRKFDTNLKSAIQYASSITQTHFEKWIKNRDLSDRLIDGMWSMLDKDKEMQKLKEEVQNHINPKLNNAYLEALEASLYGLNFNELQKRKKNDSPNKPVKTWIGETSPVEGNLLVFDDSNIDLYHELNLFFQIQNQNNNKDDNQLPALTDFMQIKELLEFIPLLMMEWLRLTHEYQLQDNSLSNNDMDPIKSMLVRVSEELGEQKIAFKKSLMYFAAMLGIDIGDGKIDSIPYILDAIGINISQTAAGKIMIVAFTLFALDSLWKNILLSERNKNTFVNRMCIAYNEAAYAEIYSKVFGFFQEIDDLVHKQISLIMGYDQQYNKAFYYSKCKNEAVDAIDRMLAYEVMQS